LKKWYLRLRPFELQGNGAIYFRLGARIYKKFVPTSGDLVTRLRGIKRLKIVETGDRRVALENYMNLTLQWEWRHLISAIFLQSWALLAGTFLGIEHFWISSTINIFVNFYPIIVQRFNRVRLVGVIAKMRPNKVLKPTGNAS
jgi:hypothetical protein